MKVFGRTTLALLILSSTLAGCTRTAVTETEGQESVVSLEGVRVWPVRAGETQGSSSAVVRVGDEQLDLEIVDTPSERQRGLGYRDTVEKDGMLFLFDADAPQPFWMKGMRFSIDIVWLNRGKVVFIEKNVPLADPNDPNPPLYGPAEQVDAVIELNAGRSAILGLAIGSTVDIQELRK